MSRVDPGGHPMTVPGTPIERLTGILRELHARFPRAVSEHSSASPEVAYLAAIDALLLSSGGALDNSSAEVRADTPEKRVGKGS